MQKGLKTTNDSDRPATGDAVRGAVAEVHEAVSPTRKSAADIVSFLVAAAAGGAVLWRSFRAPEGSGEAATEGGGTATVPSKPRSNPARPVKHERSKAARAGDSRPANGKKDNTEPGLGSAPKDTDEQCGTPIKGTGPLGKELWCRFQSSECMTRAHALAFIGVLSLGPVLLFALAALGFVIHDAAQVERFVHDLVGRLLPGRQASLAANNLIAQTHILESAHTLMRGKWWAVSIGIVSTIWAAIGLFTGIADAINAAWSVRETRSFVKLRLICLAVFLGAGVLFLLSLVPSSLPSLVGRVHLPVIGVIPRGWWIDVVSWLLAIVINGAMFTVIYRFLPNARVPWKSAMFAGAIAGLLWELFKQAFAMYVAHFGNFDKLYGTLGGAVLMVTWILYSCIVLLACAIVSKMHSEHVYDGGVVGSGK